jgi:hypothetical protein
MPRIRIAPLGLLLMFAFAGALALAAPGSATEGTEPAPVTPPAEEAPPEEPPVVEETPPQEAPADTETEPAPVEETPREPAPGTTRGTPRAGSVDINLNRSTVVYGQDVIASGTIAPAAAEPLTVERFVGGSWVAVATTSTGPGGNWSVSITPTQNWTIRARMDDNSAVTGAVNIKVLPKFTVTHKKVGTTFVGVPIRSTVTTTYHGKVRFDISYARRVRGTLKFRPTTGKANVLLPAPGYGQMRVKATFPSSNGFTGRTVTFKISARKPTIRRGSRGPAVRGLIRKLKQLRFHTPATRTWDYRMGDVILAFHKSQRMSRTSSLNASTWRRLTLASPMRPKYRSPRNHIEVDKSRQIMMVVRGGKVIGTMHVSTGATGNTPVGKWRIYQKGGSYLYKFMAFVGNFGIHGYVPVPAFPASHGCVREPMWAAAWTFRHADMGERVIIYR